MKKITLLIAFLLALVTSGYSQTIVIGTGTVSTGGTGSDPVDGYFEAMRYQVVYTAAELSASLTPYDQITALGFSISEDYAGGALLGYSIKMGHTSATNSATHNASSTSVVKNAFDYDPTVTAAGVFDMIVFDTPFVWNGVDNILIDICTDGPNAYVSPYGGVRVTNIANGSRRFRTDGAPACSVNTGTVNANRPNIQFNYVDGVPPSCLAPGGLAAAPVAATTATVSWNAVTPTPSVGYEYAISSTNTPPSGAGTPTTATSASFSGLTALSTYYVFVRSDCGSGFSSWSSVSFTTLLANDNFVDAEAVLCGATVTGDTSTATLDEDSAPDGFGCNLDGKNVWYKYTGLGTPELITLDLCASTFDTQVMVYTGTSGALTLIAGNDDSCGTRSLTSFTSNGTSTYYISIDGYTTSQGAYSMTLTCAPACTPAVTNQACASALAVATNGVDVSSDNTCGDVSAVQPSCDPFGTVQDVWFSFVAPASGNVSCLVTPTTMTSGNFAVLGGTDCGSLTEVAGTCNSNFTAGTTEILTGLTGGATYYVQVWSNTAEQGTFTINLTEPCLAPTGFAAGNFTATTADITWTPGVGSFEYVFDTNATDPAGAGTAIGVGAYTATGLTAGTVYYLHVRTDCGSSTFSPWANFAFMLPPTNDNCAGAIALTPGAIFEDQDVSGTVLGGTTAADVPSCATGVADVWYSVVVPASGTLTIETQEDAANSITDSVISVYSGACGALTEIDCDDESGLGSMSLLSLTGLNPGDTLYIEVSKWNSMPSTTVNQFLISAYDATLSTNSFDLNGFKAYPNPVKDIFKVSYTKNISTVSVTNLVGQEVLSKKVNALQSDVDMSALASGTYLVKITSEGLTKTLKVIKE
ncbi:T9SS type A sorting domain-containing protein [Flavobacterium amnicola]|uniref:T9SS type A sorting domain-containing protein n=1 Tax=Flavobacterium amnicola TaxID=2506422 RepID=A0A4Q1K3S9_9FLAO|nr:T9SS type A sorting domain-containing protein [Flavobacterium amnicola]RXR19242.1 T9SS type A sorting domain-containing protein [Flavobacterium amnicola]